MRSFRPFERREKDLTCEGNVCLLLIITGDVRVSALATPQDESIPNDGRQKGMITGATFLQPEI